MKRLAAATLTLCFLVILAGSYVRASGAGLGCPDWPRCFGRWIPPTSVEQIPPDYKELYRVAGREIADFDAFKTWTEYLNRLVGALLGVFIIGLLCVAYKRRRENKILLPLSFFALFLVSFQGWLGSVVVATHLKPVIITAHMLLALLLLLLLNEIYRRAGRPEKPLIASKAWWTLWGAFFVQVALGLRVREKVDYLKNDLSLGRYEWGEFLGNSFLIHRSFSIFLLLLLFWICRPWGWRLKKWPKSLQLMAALFLLNVLSGILMKNFHFPPFTQPIHLVGAMLLLLSAWRLRFR